MSAPKPYKIYRKLDLNLNELINFIVENKNTVDLPTDKAGQLTFDIDELKLSLYDGNINAYLLASSDISVDTNLSNDPDKLATRDLIKTYVENKLASAVDYQGSYDATTAPNNAAKKGYMYTVTVAGDGIGFFNPALEIGDVIIAEVDNPSVEADWTVVNKNLDPAAIKISYESNADTNAFTDAEQSKLAGIEDNADVTDATNVEAAGAVMESDTSTASMAFVIDEDDMSSDLDTKVPTQQSVKAYVDSSSANVSNYIDITGFISGYTITSTDANKLITNSNVNLRTVIIPSSLNLPNNTIFIKGRIAIQPNAGVNIELPDTTIITSPTQFTCEADKMYVLHRKQFTGDEWILVELSAVLLTDGSGTTANGLSIDLGGVLNPAFTLIKGATDGSSLLFFGGNAENENLAQLMANAQSVILNALTSYDGNGGGHIVNLNPGGFESTNYLTENTSSSIGNYSAGNYLHYYDNRKFNLQINSPGIAPGSGESFTINGVTFTEGIDFTGQSNNILDAQTIAGLNYSGVTDFVSVTYIDNVVYFTFSNIATVSKTIANSLFTRRFYKVEISSDFNGLTLKDGGDGFSINKFLGEYTFTDTTTLPKGIKYADNYDATLVDDSLVPKRYADTKEPAIIAGTTSEYYRGDKTFQTLDKTAVGLSNVDNTSDLDKPISTATQTELDLITDINWLGDYNNGYTYAVGDGVMFNGASFRMIAFIGAAGYNPSAYPANWLQITEYYNIIQDTTPQLGGDLDLNGNDINGTGNVDITGNVIADIVQLRGGVGAQGEMSWSTDEETVQLVMDGTTLHIGQDTFVHVRNNTASIITKGTAVYATGTLGASGRITVAPMIANGTIAGRYFIGLAAEDIIAGTDGQVMTFGKIRQINTSAFNDGDVLWLSPTVAGQLTATEPTAPNLKIATAFVIHAANNGTLMVRAEQGTDLHNDQRVQVSGLTNGDVLTWSNANQRWENEQPVDTNFANTDLTLTGNRTHELSGNTLNFSNSATNFLRLNTFNEIFTFGKGDTTNLYFGNNVLRNVTSGLQNVIVGNDINGITTGQVNTFVGFRAGQNLNNSGNSFFGGFAGYTLTSGANNVIIGRSAAYLTNSGGAVTNLENSIVIGETARVLNSGDVNTIVIGRNSRGLGSNTVVIGNSDITRTQLRGRVEMDTTTDGILLPRLTTAQMNAIVSPTTNILIYNTDLNGLYRYNGSAWVALSTGYGIISVNDVSGAPTYYATFKSAVDAIGGNGVVNLHSNISVTAVGEMPTIGTNDTLTINGNGYTITHTCNSGSDFHLVDCTSNTAKIYLNNVKIVSNGTASGSYVASVFGGINNSPSLIELSSDSIITTTNNGIREFGTIRGGTLICSNGLIAIATTIKNAEVTTKYASASMFNCNVTVVSGGYIGSGGAYEINGCNITGDATSVTPIRLEPNAKFWNNNVVITTGGQDAIYIQSGTPDKWININNCYIRHLGTGRGIFGQYISEIHNTTVYAESNVACYTETGYPTYAYNGATIKNCTFITNSASHSAYSSLNVNTRKLQNVTAVCRNAANTQPAFNISMNYASAILTVTDCEAIVNNASAYNFQTTSSTSGVYVYGLKMSVLGLGMNLSTTLLNTNTTDAFGNVKMG